MATIELTDDQENWTQTLRRNRLVQAMERLKFEGSYEEFIDAIESGEISEEALAGPADDSEPTESE